MLKVEIIKFEAQDIITASGVAEPGVTVIDPCSASGGHNMSFTNVNGTWQMACSNCGYTGSTTGGSVTVGP